MTIPYRGHTGLSTYFIASTYQKKSLFQSRQTAQSRKAASGGDCRGIPLLFGACRFRPWTEYLCS
jgi:hypothetical protein